MGKTSKTLRILLVEDNEHDRLAFRRALKKGRVSCEITEYVRAEEALERIRTDYSSFDLAVVDYILPGISGMDMCRKLLDEGIPLPLVLQTGYGSEQLAIEALKMGVQDYIIKDSNKGYLKLLPVVLREIVRRHHDQIALKEAEKLLQEKQLLNDLLLNSLPHPAMLVNKKRVVLAANLQALAIGTKIDDYCWKEFGQCEYLSEKDKKRIKKNPHAKGIQCTFCRADEAMNSEMNAKNDPEVHAFGRIWDTYWVPVDNDIFLHYAIDITERKRAAKELVESRVRLEMEKRKTEAVQIAEKTSRLASIGIIAGGITHEINQPLTAIKITTDSIIFWDKKNKGLLPEKFLNMLKRISESVDRINEIIQHMRLFWTSSDQIEKKTLDLNEIIINSLSLVDRQLQTHGIEMEKALCDSALLIEGNHLHLEQIVINLVVNAMNSLDSVERKDKKIEVKTRRKDSSAFLEVKDNGTGLPVGNRDKIFDPFFSTRKPGEGMGLGLAIVKNFVKDHKGKITTRNNKTGGSSFIIRFPISLSNKEINNEHTYG